MKIKTYINGARVLLAAFVIIATGASFTHAGDSDQPTKPNPFDGIADYVMYIDDTVYFEDFYPMFQVCFTNLVNYQPVATPGCSILEVYNVTHDHPINFYPTDEVMGEEPYTPTPDYYGNGLFFSMSQIWVYGLGFNHIADDGDLLRIRFRVANDIEYESPEFELYAPYLYSPNAPTGGPNIYWD
jgi:hypothetical protein